MKNVQIQAIRVGNTVNVSLCGKLHKKNCGNSKEADGLFKLVLKAKEDPTDENIKAIKCYLNEKLRVAFLVGLEHCGMYGGWGCVSASICSGCTKACR